MSTKPRTSAPALALLAPPVALRVAGSGGAGGSSLTPVPPTVAGRTPSCDPARLVGACEALARKRHSDASTGTGGAAGLGIDAVRAKQHDVSTQRTVRRIGALHAVRLDQRLSAMPLTASARQGART
jgi:hypothetical protein